MSSMSSGIACEWNLRTAPAADFTGRERQCTRALCRS